MKGHNVFAVLPTGYSAMAGLCHGRLPIVFYKLLGEGGEDRSINA